MNALIIQVNYKPSKHKKMIRLKNLMKAVGVLLLFSSYNLYSQTACNSNSYLNSVDPNTIEYDNLLSNFHSSLVREANGDVLTWGENAASTGASHLLVTTKVIPANGFSYTGTILKTAVGSNSINNDQMAVLTTTGLYVWGVENNLIAGALTSSNAFNSVSILTEGGSATNTTGLPDGVAPTDVKMMFGSYLTLAIVTNSGAGYILSGTMSKNGDGTTGITNKWHRIKTNSTTNLSDIKVIRGVHGAMFALTGDGNIYTWGTGAYKGDGNAPLQLNYATLMNKPGAVTGTYPGSVPYVKMIGMTTTGSGSNSYFLLASDGKLYSLGANGNKQLGDFTTNERRSWVIVEKTNGTAMDNVAWISPQEHDRNDPAINALRSDGTIYRWGKNGGRMLAQQNEGSNYDPELLNDGTTGILSTDVLMAVETGGHTTMVVKKCTFKFGYVGHRINGSMADNTSDSEYEPDFNFANTAPLNLCGAATVPAVQDLKICPNTTVNINTAFVGTVPLGQTLHWYTTTTKTPGTEIVTPFMVGPGTYYAFFEGDCPNPPYSTVHVTYYVPTDPGYASCICYNSPYTPNNGPATKEGITLLKRAGSGNTDNWPMLRKSGHIALESNTKGFVVTRIAKANLTNITNPQEGMMVYDTTDKCLKIYSDGAWKCFNIPGCP